MTMLADLAEWTATVLRNSCVAQRQADCRSVRLMQSYSLDSTAEAVQQFLAGQKEGELAAYIVEVAAVAVMVAAHAGCFALESD